MAKSNIIVKANYDPVSDVLTRLEGGIKSIITDKSIAEGTSIIAANKLMYKIKDKYHSYLSTISNYEHNTSDILMTVTDTKAGWVVHVSGDDLLYHEYGTGTRGLEDPHPEHDKKGMKPYGSGQNVIRGTYQVRVTYYTDKKYDKVKWIYVNKNNGKRTPKWYPLFLEGRDFPNDLEEQPSSKDYLWRHNGIITKGLPAGKFVYDSVNEIAEYDISGRSSTLKHTMTQTLKKEFVGRLNNELKQYRAKYK